MLKIVIPAGELWDSKQNVFVYLKEHTIFLEHSLRSIAKWEAIHNVPFLDHKMTKNETLDYIRCMTITQNVNPLSYGLLQTEQLNMITEYINLPMTATTVNDKKRPGARKEIITSELIYYWMIICGIPFECEKWNFNRLMTLIRVCFIKNAPAHKMSRSDVIGRYKDLNAKRRAATHSRG